MANHIDDSGEVKQEQEEDGGGGGGDDVWPKINSLFFSCYDTTVFKLCLLIDWICAKHVN